MPERPSITIPGGQGLSRDVGAYVADAMTMRDLRNVELRAGRTFGRRGLVRLLTLGDELDEVERASVIGIFPMQSTGGAVAFTYSVGDSVNPDVRVDAWRVDEDLASATLIDTVWTFGGLQARIPIVRAADSYGKMLIAHDLPGLGQRSRVYDDGTGLITDLDLGDGMHTPKFRGFRRHLAYIFGWGWGTDADPNRPEVVRVCQPADPLTWDINHYFVTGQRDDPVLNCDPAGDVLMVQKADETHDIIGYDRATFGVRPGDQYFGVLSGGASITVGGVNYRWSRQGPRRSAGGTSEDIGAMLALNDPPPDALANPTQTAERYVFAFYDPILHEIGFVHSSRWGYILHLDAPGLTWSYRPYGVLTRVAGLSYDTRF